MVLDQACLSEGKRIIEAADEWVAISARTPDALVAACRAFGVERLDDAEAIARSRTATALIDALVAAGVPATLVRRDQRGEFFDDPDNIAAGMVASYPHPEWGRFEQPGAAWYLGDQSTRHLLAPPVLGGHTIEVLLDVGVSRAEIDALIAGGAALAQA